MTIIACAVCSIVVDVGHLREPRPSGEGSEHKSCLKATVYVSLYHFPKQICKRKKKKGGKQQPTTVYSTVALFE